MEVQRRDALLEWATLEAASLESGGIGSTSTAEWRVLWRIACCRRGALLEWAPLEVGVADLTGETDNNKK